ncbi:15695_t:CDS:2 [Gigaspora rosea]|nr:15695_t:CDS:2 [Gigaspora rosea]
MNPFGNACYNRTTNFFNTSFSNTITSDYEEFKLKYIQSELISIWANDTIKFNNQIFEQIQIGFPKDVNGSENIVIPDTVSGQIGLMPYQNKQIVGIALSMNSTDIGLGGTITFGGIDLDHIQGNNESNIVYQPLPQLIDSNKLFTVNVTNIYINNSPINLNGLIWFDTGLQNIHFDDNSANMLIKNLPGGKYSNGTSIVDCNISDTFDLSFEIAGQKWRIPSSAISKNSVNNTNQCESTITGSAYDGNFYMVFDQTNSQIGIAFRSDITYGPPPGPPVLIIQLPEHFYSGDNRSTGCLKIVNNEFGSQSFTIENKPDSDGFYSIEDGVFPIFQDYNYTFYFYPDGRKNSEECAAESADGIAYLAVLLN